MALESVTEDVEQKPSAAKCKVKYGIDSKPPWYLCILLGFQHYMTMAGGMVIIPFLVSSVFCIGDDLVATSEIFATTFFVCGIGTFLQTTVGCRLPIVQGASFSYLLAAMSILSLEKWKCTTPAAAANQTAPNTSMGVQFLQSTNESDIASSWTEDSEVDTVDPMWKYRMREIQGALLVSGLIECVLGLTGLVGIIAKLMGPMTVSVVISLVGLSLFSVAADYCAKNWWIAFLTMALIALFTLYLGNFEFPLCVRQNGRWQRTGFPLLKLFPVVLAIALSSTVCAILTVADVVPNDPAHWAYHTRTDIKTHVLQAASWFRLPHPFPWGFPTFSAAGATGMLAVLMTTVADAIGDYYICADVSGAPVPPAHAINRGIMMDGICTMAAGAFGTGAGLCSFSENVGAISITGVASRRIMLAGSALMVILGVLGKFGALFVCIPEPVTGGVFVVVFGAITAVGVTSLQHLDMNSPRNLFIFGLSVLIAMTLPSWLQRHPSAINTGLAELDRIITVSATTSMFVGGVIAMFLDNTVPGSAAERGLVAWNAASTEGSSQADKINDDVILSDASVYDLPFVTPLIRRCKCARYWPISPTFVGFRCRWPGSDRKQSNARQEDGKSPINELKTVSNGEVNYAMTSRF